MRPGPVQRPIDRLDRASAEPYRGALALSMLGSRRAHFAFVLD